MDSSDISYSQSPPVICNLTQSRSAESTPVMFRRYLRITGLFNSCTMHPETADEGEDENDSSLDALHKTTRVNRPSKQQRRRRPISADISSSSVPASPSLLATDHYGGGRLSKRVRLWRSLKKFNFRQRLRRNSNSLSPSFKKKIANNGRRASFSETYTNINGSEINRILNSNSQPNLHFSDQNQKDVVEIGRLIYGSYNNQIEHTYVHQPAFKFGALFSRHKKRRNEQRPISYYTPSTNSGSILGKNSANHKYRVEFAATDQVIPLISEDPSSVSTCSPPVHRIDINLSPETHSMSQISSMTSPVKTLFNRSKGKVERQTTFESTSSVTTEDILRQETLSGSGAEQDTPPPISSYLLHVHLKEGKDLVIRDASGNKLIYKSNTIFKNLNPHWDEQFADLIDDPNVPLHVDVFDYDRFASDDFMGFSTLDLTQLQPKKPTDVKLSLREENSDQYMGYLLIQVSLSPLTKEELEQYLRKKARGSPESVGGTSAGNATPAGSVKRSQKSSQIWNSVVNIVLVEGKNLLPTDTHTSMPLPDPYVKFKLGVEKYKSKAANKTLEPKWLEQFDLHIFDDQNQQLEIMVFDKRKDIFMGRCKIDLSTIEREVTQQNWYELEDGAGQILLLLTISGTVGTETVTDFSESASLNTTAMTKKYALEKTFQNLRDIGHLVVKVYRAQGLASADIGGKSDPFCVVELVNARLQTHTEYKTLNPEWNKIFTFNVKDIHSVLELTVYDEDPNKKVEFLGKVSIPLLKIRNGEKRWYALKDRKLQHRAKGQILLEMEVVWNPIRASIRTFNPKEEKYMAHENKFKRQTFMRNVMRVKNFAMAAMDVGAFVQSCFEWDSPPRSIVAFLIYVVVVYFFEIYMLPLVLLLLFIKAYMYKVIIAGMKQSKEDVDVYFESEEEDEEMDDKEERKSFKERLQAIQDTLAMVQNALDYIASSLERVKNTFNFTQPFLSWLTIVLLCAVTTVLYFIPIRWLAMAWGINKFTKKLRCPNAVPNNELLDFLSRVPSDDEIRMFGEFRPDPVDGATAAIMTQAVKNKKHRSS